MIAILSLLTLVTWNVNADNYGLSESEKEYYENYNDYDGSGITYDYSDNYEYTDDIYYNYMHQNDDYDATYDNEDYYDEIMTDDDEGWRRAGRAFRRAGDAIRRTASRAGGAIARTATRTGNAIARTATRTGNTIARTATRTWNSVINSPAAKKAANEFKKWGEVVEKNSKKVTKQIVKFGKWIGRGVPKVITGIKAVKAKDSAQVAAYLVLEKAKLKKVCAWVGKVDDLAKEGVKKLGKWGQDAIKAIGSGKNWEKVGKALGGDQFMTVWKNGKNFIKNGASKVFKNWDDDDDFDAYSQSYNYDYYNNNNDYDNYYYRRGRRLTEKELLDNWQANYDSDLLMADMSMDDNDKFSTEMINEILESERSTGISFGLKRVLKDPNLNTIEKTNEIRRRLEDACSIRSPDSIINDLQKAWKPLSTFLKTDHFWDDSSNGKDDEDDYNYDYDSEYNQEYDNQVSAYDYYKYRRLVSDYSMYDADVTESQCSKKKLHKHGAIKIVAVVPFSVGVTFKFFSASIGGCFSYGIVIDLTQGYVAQIIELGGGLGASFSPVPGDGVSGSIGIGLSFGWAADPAAWYGPYWAVELGVQIPALPGPVLDGTVGIGFSVWGGINPATYGGFQFTVTLNGSPMSEGGPSFSVGATGGITNAWRLVCQKAKQCACSSKATCWVDWDNSEKCWETNDDEDDYDNYYLAN